MDISILLHRGLAGCNETARKYKGEINRIVDRALLLLITQHFFSLFVPFRDRRRGKTKLAAEQPKTNLIMVVYCVYGAEKVLVYIAKVVSQSRFEAKKCSRKKHQKMHNYYCVAGRLCYTTVLVLNDNNIRRRVRWYDVRSSAVHCCSMYNNKKALIIIIIIL